MTAEPAIATLVLGLLIGYVGQRSRMCFIGGVRDFMLVRDGELLKGLLAFFVTAWTAFAVAGLMGLLGDGWSRGGLSVAAAGWTVGLLAQGWMLAIAVVAGFAVGLFSVFANGCPFRQHVLAAQGDGNAALYLAGFYGGILIYGLVLVRLASRLLTG
ncbi:MAG: transporter [Candidatus Dormibacter sp.]|uniref:transporter n=1 Tax=Candidatus Dormibacter sp. TaxID=2973982 RepID=UPI000DB1D205|nr:MAG: transporter [Candidatus Dormibacteraeota bacterium]